jgi:hypothetical protein
MKYIKKYEVFESIISDDDLKEDIVDILIPFEDMGYEISVNYNVVGKLPFGEDNVEGFLIRIVRYDDPILKINNEVKDILNRLNTFLNEYNYNITFYYVKESIQLEKSYTDFINSVNKVRNLLLIIKKV